VSTEEVSAKVTKALPEVLENGFQECVYKLYEHWQKCVITEGNYYDGDVVQVD
jgi:hypothetical protein